MNPLAPAPVTPSNLKNFVLGGNATFTVRSERTGTRFTFKVRQPSDDAPHFVSLMNGPDNENSFVFLGTLFSSGTYAHGKKSSIGESAPSAVAARWVVSRIANGLPLNGVEVWHEGRCGCCGRKLTVPESIESGIGPECAKRLAGA